MYNLLASVTFSDRSVTECHVNAYCLLAVVISATTCGRRLNGVAQCDASYKTCSELGLHNGINRKADYFPYFMNCGVQYP